MDYLSTYPFMSFYTNYCSSFCFETNSVGPDLSRVKNKIFDILLTFL